MTRNAPPPSTLAHLTVITLFCIGMLAPPATADPINAGRGAGGVAALCEVDPDMGEQAPPNPPPWTPPNVWDEPEASCIAGGLAFYSTAPLAAGDACGARPLNCVTVTGEATGDARLCQYHEEPSGGPGTWRCPVLFTCTATVENWLLPGDMTVLCSGTSNACTFPGGMVPVTCQTTNVKYVDIEAGPEPKEDCEAVSPAGWAEDVATNRVVAWTSDEAQGCYAWNGEEVSW